MPNHCLRRTVLGIIEHPGAFAEFIRVPQGSVHLLPEEIALSAAVLIEPLAAAIRTFELTPILDHDTVVVLGCGRLGKLVALVASKLGARVIAIGRSAPRLDGVRPFVDHIIRLAPDDCANAAELRARIFDATDGLGADIVVEATGDNSNLALAQQLARPMGTVALKSTSGVPVSSLDTTSGAVNEIRFQGSRCGPFDKAIAFMQKHRVPDESWITARYPLARAADAIEAARREAKVLIDCSGCYSNLSA